MNSTFRHFIGLAALLVHGQLALYAAEPAVLPRWAQAYQSASPMNVVEARDFARRLTQYVVDNHLKKDEKSQQRGMIYEYFDVAKKGQYDQFVQGETLDTMHDGAWFAVAMASAARASGDEHYRQILDQWILPFYCKMLNHSDTLFSGKVDHVRTDRAGLWKPRGEWLFNEGEKGFVPYWWDDGGSVSLDRLTDKNLPANACFDAFVAAGQENPKRLLSGYSLGSSNHLAQDLGLMVLTSWLLFHDQDSDRGRRWSAELADAAKNLQQCRTSHGSPNIPAVLAPAALAAGDVKMLKRIADPSDPNWWKFENHYTRALYSFKPGQKYHVPPFADDQEYYYYAGISRSGGALPRNLALRLIYDAYTMPMLYRTYCDDEPAPPGIGVLDLHPYVMIDGKHVDYRSDRKGPFKKPRPVGSRFGPQNLAVTALALQALRHYPGLWDQTFAQRGKDDVRIAIAEGPLPGNDAILDVPGATIGIYSTPTALALAGEIAGPAARIAIYSRPDATGDHAILELTDRGVKAINDRDEALELQQAVQKVEGKLRFEIQLPYTINKTQKRWANAIEGGRYSIKVGQIVKNIMLVSREKDVQAALERELSLGLRTWEAVFNELGYIPTAIGEPRWQKYSDTGGYAHLIQAAAQYLYWLEGKKDWEQQHISRVQ